MNNASLQESDFIQDLKSLINPPAKNQAPVTIHANALKLNNQLLEAMPETVQQYMQYASPLTDAPDEFMLMPFLAHIGALIGQKRYLQLGAITIYPVIWTVIFAGSSTMRKSTSLNLSKKPFWNIESIFKDEYEKNLTFYRQRKELAERDKLPFDDPEPKRKTLYQPNSFSDLTFWENLRDNGHVISMASEFTGLWMELTRNRNGLQDLALQIFDAEDSIRRITRMAGDIELVNPVWCIAGATTLEAFRRSLTAAERGTGLLQRILPVTAENSNKPFKALTELPKKNEILYQQISSKLTAISELESIPLRLDENATAWFTEWSHRLNKKALALEDRISDIGGFISRLDTYCLKFSLIFQTLQDHSQQISVNNIQAAAKLCDWLLNHIVYMLERNYIFNRIYADRLKVRNLIEKHDGMMNRTDLMNYSKLDKEQLNKALDNEIDAGFIEEIESGEAKKKTRIYKRTSKKAEY